MAWKIRDAIRRRSTFGAKCSKMAPKSPASPAHPVAKIVVPSAAAEKVLKTPELLELVLAHLDQEGLLFAQRVCRHWKEIINSSLPLRRMLYLSPTSKVDEQIPVDNVWLKSRFSDFGVYLMQGNPKWRPKFISALGAKDVDRLGVEFFSQPNASWRDMYLTQPPIKEVVVYASIEDTSRPNSRAIKRNSGLLSPEEPEQERRSPSMEEMVKASVTVKTVSGVTMGMIVDAGIEAQRRGSLVARKRLTERKDSGYVSVEELRVDDIEIAVVEVTD